MYFQSECMAEGKNGKQWETAMEKLHLVSKGCDSSIFPPWIVCPHVNSSTRSVWEAESTTESGPTTLLSLELYWSKEGYFPKEELGRTLKKKIKMCAVVQLITLESRLKECKAVPTLVSTLSERGRREREQCSRREHVWSCTEWMVQSVCSGKNVSISRERSKDEKVN